MMNAALRLTALGTFLALSACDTMEVDSYYEESFDFRSLKTYQWMADRQTITGDERVKNEITMNMIKQAVDDGLAAKGYTQADSNPDFLIGYHAVVSSKLDVRTMNDYYGYGVPSVVGEEHGPGWRMSGETRTSVRRYDQGTLIIDIAEPEKRRLIWRGSAEDRVTPGNTTQDEKRARITQGIQRIFELFPPK